MARRRQLPTILPPESIHAGSPMAHRIEALIEIMEDLGYPIVPVSKKRTAAEQARLYAKGRTTPGDIVTEKSGKPGDESKHQTGDAVDFAFVKDGQPSFDESHPWDMLGQAAKAVGLEWGGDWTTLVDRPHVQMPSRATFAKGSAVQAQTDPNSVKIGRAPVAPPVPPAPTRPASPLGVGTAEAGSRATARALPPAPRVATRSILDQIRDGMRGRTGDIELAPDEPILDVQNRPGAGVASGDVELQADRPIGEFTTFDSPAPPTETPTPTPLQASKQAQTQAQQPTIIVNVPGDLVGAPDAGMIRVTLAPGTTPQQMQSEALRLAKEQVEGNALAMRGPQAGQQVGFQMPNAEASPETAEAFKHALATFPQAASFIAQFFPGVRAFGTAASMALPAGARAISNVVEGKGVLDDTLTEALLGFLLHTPQLLGETAKGAGVSKMRHELAKSPRIGDLAEQHGKAFVEDEMPEMALASRAAPTRSGVAKATDRAVEMTGAAQEATHGARDLLKGIPHPTSGELAMQSEALDAARRMGTDAAKSHALANVLEDIRFGHSMRGSGNAMTSVLPGSGAVTTLARATGLPQAVGQIASPAVAIIKGSPARRMFFARNLHRPGNVVDADTLGLLISQLLRGGYVANQAMSPVASHEGAHVGAGGGSTRPTTPRRRQ